jgi:hypothetical protein
MKRQLLALSLLFLTLVMSACNGGSSNKQSTVYFTLTVNSTNPSSGVAIAVSQADASGLSSGLTALTRSYAAGTSVMLTAPAKSSAGTFASWKGCDTAVSTVCTLTVNSDVTVTAEYSSAAVTSVTVTPNPVSLAPGATQQFAASVQGNGSYTSGVTWSVNGVAGGSVTVGTISSTGLYITPFPVPSSVTVTATSSFDTTQSGSATVTLTVPSATGPALAVDAGTETHAISPLIYGMNFYSLGSDAAAAVRLPLDRWGGDATSRYNYLLDISNAGADWFFESSPNSNTAYPDISDFNAQVLSDEVVGSKTLGTVPVLGWTTKSRSKVCGFSVAKYGVQQKTDPYWSDCGNGIHTDGSNVVSDPTDTSMAIDESWAANWVTYLVNRFGTAANGGVAIYDLDNEPSWWSSTHRDVHPLPFTYDEVTNNGLKVAKAIKGADPTAEVSGPVIDFWPAYFYSMLDIQTGWSSGPNYVYNGNPVDRKAHGNIPLLEYYLQRFKAAQDADPNNTRYLDYLDLHTYFAANNAGLNTAGTTDAQQAAINSTRALWDPTYTNSSFSDPDDTSRSPKPLAPMIIRRMQSWIAADYPGTKTAITEYNWGGQEHISGAVAQADILGIFGREGLDLGTLWGPPDSVTQKPGLLAFEIYRNYDGAGGSFGDTAVSSTSDDQGKLAVYGALRSSDNALTVVVINKSFSDLSTTLSLANLKATGAAKVYLYSSANLDAIVAQADQAVTAPVTGSTASTVTRNYPAMSITLLVIPQ